MEDEGIKLKWSLPDGTRSEALDKEVLMMMKKSDNNYLVYAPESGSQRTLKKIKKRVKLKRLIKSVIEAKRLGAIQSDPVHLEFRSSPEIRKFSSD